MTTDSVLYQVADGVATITLNRPDALNALTNEVKVSLLEALRVAAADETVRVVVLTGAGRAFCVGQDLREHVSELEANPGTPLGTVAEHYNPIALEIHTMPKPVIAAINGVAAGAGLSLAMLADLRIAAASAKFTTAFAGIALSCDTGASWTLQRLVGPTRAMEWLLRPQPVSAQVALDAGLLTEVIGDDEFGHTIAARARELADGPTLAYASIRAAVAYSATHSLDDSLTFEETKMALTGTSRDHRVAVDAFFAKEKPTFTGE